MKTDFRGAPLGQPSFNTGPKDVQRKFWLRRLRLNSQGYDNEGSYWGHGMPIYHYETVDECHGYLRADDRADAKRKIIATYPNARFFR